MTDYALKVAKEILMEDMRAGIKGVCPPPVEWQKAVVMAHAVEDAAARRAEVAAPSIPISEIEREIEHIKTNGVSLAKFGGQSADEGRCRELCAMYLRDFISARQMSKRLKELPLSGPSG